MKKEEENSHKKKTLKTNHYTSTHTMYIYLHLSVGEGKDGIQKFPTKIGRRKGQTRRATNFEKLIKKSLITLCC